MQNITLLEIAHSLGLVLTYLHQMNLLYVIRKHGLVLIMKIRLLKIYFLIVGLRLKINKLYIIIYPFNFLRIFY